MLKKHRAIQFPANVRPAIETVVATLRNAGYECYLIGGSVRDLLLGREVRDYDFATDALPKEVMRLFRRALPTGIKHGTVSVLVNGISFEITTYRSDGTYIDGRHPDTVTFSKELRIDVERRDFTINGLAYDTMTQTIIDYVNGLHDIRSRVIRTIGDPVSRFREDGLRPIRACRFAACLKFTIDEETFAAIPETLDVASKVSPERIRDELVKILESEKPSLGIEYLRRSGLLAFILPELDKCYGVDQNRYHMYDIYTHSIYSCDAAPAHQPMIRLAALLHDIGKLPTKQAGDDGDPTFYNHEVIGAKMVRRIMKRLRFSNDQIETVTNLVVNHMFHYTDEWTDGAVRRFMRKVGLENIDNLFTLRMADRKGNGARRGLPAPIERLKKRIERIIEEENAFSLKDLAINGTILMEELSLEEGPMIGKILNDLLEAVIDRPELNDRDLLLEKAREFLAARKGREDTTH